MTTTTPPGYADHSRSEHDSRNRVWRWTETKAGPKTTEFIFMVIVVAGALIAAYVDDEDSYHIEDGWLYATIAAAAYFISRGLAKSGTREPYQTDDR